MRNLAISLLLFICLCWNFNVTSATSGGCWDSVAGAPASSLSGALFCETNFTSGLGQEVVACNTNYTLVSCCKIVSSGECNKVTSCYNGNTATPCDNSAAMKDYLCGIRRGLNAVTGGCYGSTNNYTTATKENFYFEAKTLLTIPCWDPINNALAPSCTDGSFAACSIQSDNGAVECRFSTFSGYIGDGKDDIDKYGKFYCSPATGQTAGCNMKAVSVVVDGLILYGKPRSCYNPSNGASIDCTSSQWQCETTVNGLGFCTGLKTDPSSLSCVTEKNSGRQCNFVSKGGCYDTESGNLASYSSNTYNGDNIYCVTGPISGKTVESTTCQTANDLCCEIVDFVQCNKVTSCYSGGVITPCTNAGTDTDHMCGISRIDGTSNCFGGYNSPAATQFDSSSIDNYFLANVKNSNLNCYDPSTQTVKQCTAGQFYCKTMLATGVGSCESGTAIPSDSTSEYYCSPYFYNNGGCNNWSPKIESYSNIIKLPANYSGNNYQCYDASTGTGKQCTTAHWQCKTVNNGTTFIGTCEGAVTTSDTVYICTTDLCNAVTFGGCWNAPTGRLAAKYDVLNSEAYYCKTDTTTGNTVEDSTCTPGSTTLCCVIGDYRQCNRLSTCPNPKGGNTVTCSTSGSNTDYMCAIKRTDGTGLCIGSSNAYSTISSNLGDWFLTLESKMPCWNPYDGGYKTCGASDFSCKV
jgi:hypothetical protein